MESAEKAFILLIEDNPDHAALINRSFAKSRGQMTLDFVDSVASAGEYLSKALPSVILCDYLLPDGTGLEILNRFVKNNPTAPPLFF